MLITGAGSGIGARTAHRLAAEGACLALVDRDLATAEATAGALPGSPYGRHLALGADVTDSEQLGRAVETVVAELGGIDIVIANAGIGGAGTVAVSDIAALARCVEINLIGVIRTVHATLAHVCARQGYFLLVSSAAALKNVPGGSAYAAAKSGVDAFAGALRLEVAHKGVDVGVAHPAWIRTPMYQAQLELESVRSGIDALPWPFNVVTEVDDCAAAFVEGIRRRRRKVFVPRVLAVVDALRSLFTGALWDMAVKRKAAVTVAALEQEILAQRAQP